jgi:hypothetical protein
VAGGTTQFSARDSMAHVSIPSLSPSIHKSGKEFIYSGLSAVRQAHRSGPIEGLND